MVQNSIDDFLTDMDSFREKKAAETVVMLPLKQLRPNPYQPRKQFDEAALQELAASIQKNGVFQPIIVRESVNGYEIVAGERRFRASEMVGKPTIPAIIRPVAESLMMQVAILENLQRADLNPLEEAEAYAAFMKRLKLTQAEVAKRLGKSRPYIANSLRLLTLPQAVKILVQRQQLSTGQARTLLGLHDKNQMVELAHKVVRENLTVRQVEKLVNQMNQVQPVSQTAPQKSPYLRASETRLAMRLGTKVNIATHGEKGKIEIDYLSTADLNRLLTLLKSLTDPE
ncbi:ParB/RepB/Spo0J family partition protein [Loigolactobacillus bifermentans]|jgi:ParB family chromosome partitioning protein|uniref:Spo0J-like protein, ParB-like nuclease domain n=1 Tax=Loigolactobacillus bifermentans DSM 20003 TaxID=1423726 RepID=A0A0R1HAN6_9LACO|nr:Spo0J-like protein, ParB-like nuclease domain [Loigolactobacillus bifermentans DSM 20003]QGG60928.1 ParB/RepB/Spo0J family partition protein [Loigolactobacillus bifermentans]